MTAARAIASVTASWAAGSGAADPRCLLCREHSARLDADGLCDACIAHPVCADCRVEHVAVLYDSCAACRAASAARFERELDRMVGSDPRARAQMTRWLADGIEFPGYTGTYLPVEWTLATLEAE